MVRLARTREGLEFRVPDLERLPEGMSRLARRLDLAPEFFGARIDSDGRGLRIRVADPAASLGVLLSLISRHAARVKEAALPSEQDHLWPALVATGVPAALLGVALRPTGTGTVLGLGVLGAAGLYSAKAFRGVVRGPPESRSFAVNGGRPDLLLEAAREHAAQLRFAAGLRLGAVTLSVVPIAMLAGSVDLLTSIREKQTRDLSRSLFVRLGMLGGVGLLAEVARGALVYASEVETGAAAQSIVHHIRMRVYQHVQELPMEFFDGSGRGELVAGLNENVNEIERLFDGLRSLLDACSAVAAIGVMLSFVAPEVAWLVLLALPLFTFTAVNLQNDYAPLFKSWLASGGKLNGVLSNALGGIATIKALSAEADILQRVKLASLAYRASAGRAMEVGAAFPPLLDVLVMGSMSTALVAGGALNARRMTPGKFAAVLYLSRQLLLPLSDLGRVAAQLNRGLVAYRRVVAPLAAATEHQSDRGTERPAPIAGSVRIRELHFAYAERPVLSGISIAMRPGTTTALVGATGSGKTTLIKLLMRFYDFEQGSIELDGHDIRTIELAYLRSLIGVVTQDTFLFDGSVKDNLLLAAPGASDAELSAVLRAAGADEFVAQLSGGIDTQLGEQGARLSGGQRQRLSIARALLKDARIVIFDEATSHVDNKTEALIYEGVRAQLRERTVIVVAHRLSTVQHADQICVLKHGTIVERGAHAELLEKNGEYALLWRLQLGLA